MPPLASQSLMSPFSGMSGQWSHNCSTLTRGRCHRAPWPRLARDPARTNRPAVRMKHQLPGFRMLLLRVAVGNDDDIGVAKVFGQIVGPFAGASGIAGGRNAGLARGIDVAFAFDDQQHPAVIVEQLRQPIRHLPDALDAPTPARGIARIGPALPEVLGLIAADLKQQLAVFVGVVIARERTARAADARHCS